MGYKKCPKCDKLKTTENFSKINGKLRSYCKDCKKEESAAWRSKNPKYNKEYREKHIDKAIEYGRKYYRENKEELIIKNKKYINDENNKKRSKERKRKWYVKNKEKVMEGKRRRRARISGCNENYTLSDREITLEAFDHKCFNCGIKENICIDHHRPLVMGNPLSLMNAVVLCKLCNSSKGTKSPESFYGTKKCAELNKKLALINEDNLKKGSKILPK